MRAWRRIDNTLANCLNLASFSPQAGIQKGRERSRGDPSHRVPPPGSPASAEDDDRIDAPEVRLELAFNC